MEFTANRFVIALVGFVALEVCKQHRFPAAFVPTAHHSQTQCLLRHSTPDRLIAVHVHPAERAVARAELRVTRGADDAAIGALVHFVVGQLGADAAVILPQIDQFQLFTLTLQRP